jgi:hypothetical protein
MAQVQSATVDEPGVRMLADLKARYGSIDLIWRDKNTLHSAIGAKQTEIDGKLRQARLQKNDDKCLPVLADIGIPPDFADAVLVPESETTNLSRFLCAAAVHNGKVTITAAATDVYKVAFAGAYLKFRVIRPSRYLKDAVKTTTVEAIGNDRGEEPADISIVHYLDGQFALSFARFMAQ